MSHDELEKYRALYGEYVSHMVDLHNTHQEYLRNTTYKNGNRIRTSLRKMIALNRELVKQTKGVYKEYMANLEEYRHQQTLPRPRKKTGRPRKGEIRLPKHKLGQSGPGRPKHGESNFDLSIANRDKKA